MQITTSQLLYKYYETEFSPSPFQWLLNTAGSGAFYFYQSSGFQVGRIEGIGISLSEIAKKK